MNNKKSKKTILFLIFYTNACGNITNHFLKHGGGSLASSRLQVTPMLEAILKADLQPSIWSLHSNQTEAIKRFKEIKHPAALVIGKMSSDDSTAIESMIQANTQAILYAKQSNIPTVVLYSDNHLCRRDKIGDFYRGILNCADSAIVPSKSLAESISKYTKDRIKCFCIKDPWQAELTDFHATKNLQESTKLIWFGSGRNIHYLLNILPELFRNCMESEHYSLTILSRKNVLQYAHQKIQTFQKPCKKWTIKYARWDDENQPNQLNSLLQSSDISLIPSDPNDPKKIGVSHNRLVDSIRAGCVTVASPLASYKELSNSALLGNDFANLVNHAVINYKSLCQKYTRNRAEWMPNFSPEKNSKDWEFTVKSLFISR